MIKTATPSGTQETVTENTGYEKDAQVRQSTAKESTAKQSPTIKEQGVIVTQYPAETGNIPKYQDILNELQEKKNLLLKWQDELNRNMKDPANANKVVEYLTGLQYLKNTIADLSSQLGIMSVSTNGYTFQDNQSVLQSASVRRKDTEALREIQEPVIVFEGNK